jgi:hypothetical protein
MSEESELLYRFREFLKRGNVMKKLIIGFILATSSAFAAEVMILDEHGGFNDPNYVYGSFVVKNEEAKVELMFDSSSSEAIPSYETYDLAGLEFDGTSVTFGQTVCAVKNGRKIRSTGLCEFKTVIEGRRLRTYMIVNE